MSSLKKFLANNWASVLIILIICVGVILLWQRCKPSPKTSEVKQVDTALLLHKVDTLRDKNDKLYATLEQQVYTQAQVNHLLDSVAKALGIKVKYIEGAERITVEVDTVYRDLPSHPIIIAHNMDTAFRVERHDGWNDIVATAGPDSGSIVFRSRDTISRIEVVKTPLVGSTKRYVYINNANPYVKIQEGASFVIKEKQPYLTFGPSVQYTPFGNKFNVGVSVQIPIITLKR